jgi:hypothetical protein
VKEHLAGLTLDISCFSHFWEGLSWIIGGGEFATTSWHWYKQHISCLGASSYTLKAKNHMAMLTLDDSSLKNTWGGVGKTRGGGEFAAAIRR